MRIEAQFSVARHHRQVRVDGPKMEHRKIIKIAIIGAGPSGLCCAKHALDHGHDVTVYEMNSKVGGTWVYTDRVGSDEIGVTVHSSMYQGLR